MYKNVEKILELKKEKSEFIVNAAINFLFSSDNFNNLKDPLFVKGNLRMIENNDGISNNILSTEIEIEILKTAAEIAQSCSVDDILTYVRKYTTSATNDYDSISKDRLYELLCGVINNKFADYNMEGEDFYDELSEIGFTGAEISTLGYAV